MKNSGEESLISIYNIGKAYRRYSCKVDVVKQWISRSRKQYYDEKWALRNFSAEFKRGECIGVIGRNGSGKSTMLQLICGTISPSEGKVVTRGKIGALLELGSGFNPEFTGLENIFLNGAILGLKKKQVETKLDEILSFADIGESVNDPVKTYSSGMIVRLAFSVITNLDTDILVIDEALAVGDAFFTQKCMRFIRSIRENRCLIFVSHDADSVMSICDKAILLEDGKDIARGNPKEIVEKYTNVIQDQLQVEALDENSAQNKKEKVVIPRQTEDALIPKREYISQWTDYRLEAIKEIRPKNYIANLDLNIIDSRVRSEYGEGAEIERVAIKDASDERNIKYIRGGEIIKLIIDAKLKKEINRPIVGFILKDSKGQTIMGDNTYNHDCPMFGKKIEKGTTLSAEFLFTVPLLKKGKYSITVAIANGDQEIHEILHWINDVMILGSECSSVAAGLAGVPMHSVKMTATNEAK